MLRSEYGIAPWSTSNHSAANTSWDADGGWAVGDRSRGPRRHLGVEFLCEEDSDLLERPAAKTSNSEVRREVTLSQRWMTSVPAAAAPSLLPALSVARPTAGDVVVPSTPRQSSVVV